MIMVCLEATYFTYIRNLTHFISFLFDSKGICVVHFRDSLFIYQISNDFNQLAVIIGAPFTNMDWL